MSADVDDDELERLDARFDPAYAAFKTQLDALLRERIPRQFQHLIYNINAFNINAFFH